MVGELLRTLTVHLLISVMPEHLAALTILWECFTITDMAN